MRTHQPNKKVDKFDPRTEHFQLISKPTLILQGERDVFGNKEFFEANKDKAQLVNKYASLFWINDGDNALLIAKTMPRIFKGLASPSNLPIKIGKSPKLVRRHDNEKALLLGQSDAEDGYWSICHLEDDLRGTDPFLVSNVESNKIRFEYLQPMLDGENFESLSFLIMNYLKETNSYALVPERKSGVSGVPEYIWQLSKLISSSSNQVIVDNLRSYTIQSQLIMNYAQRINRQKLPVTDLNHAIAMLGVIRIFPIICLNELKVIERENMDLNGPYLFHKAIEFSSIARSLSALTKIDLAEYCEFTARLISISYCPTLDLPSWYKRSKAKAVDWQLPQLYLSALECFFQIKASKRQLSEISRKSAPLVSLLLLTDWIHSYVNDIALQNSNKHVNTEYLAAVGLSLPEFKALMESVIDDVSPKSYLV